MTHAAKATRIKATDNLGNVAYVHNFNGHWCCNLDNGTAASLWYAGLGNDHMAAEFALDDCMTSADVLHVVQGMGSRQWKYEIVSHGRQS